MEEIERDMEEIQVTAQTADYSKLLATYKEPTVNGVKQPYMLWGRVARVRGLDGSDNRQPDLAELRLVGCHSHPEKAVQYAGWGWKLLKYWTPSTPKYQPITGILSGLLSAGQSNELAKELELERAKNKVLEGKVKGTKAND